MVALERDGNSKPSIMPLYWSKLGAHGRIPPLADTRLHDGAAQQASGDLYCCTVYDCLQLVELVHHDLVPAEGGNFPMSPQLGPV